MAHDEPSGVPASVESWATPDGGFERVIEPTRRRSPLRTVAAYALGFGGGTLIIGLLINNDTNRWLGVTFLVLGLLVTGYLGARPHRKSR